MNRKEGHFGKPLQPPKLYKKPILKGRNRMNLHYLMNELYYQRRRTIAAIVGLSIGIALLIILNALSAAYRQAAHAPSERDRGRYHGPAAGQCAQGSDRGRFSLLGRDHHGTTR